MRPRSGLAAKHGVTVLNSPGTVDADYRGEINVLLINHGEASFPIRRGERIAQMVIAPVVQAQLVPVGVAFEQPTVAAAVSVRPGAESLQFERFDSAFRCFFHSRICVHGLELYGRLPKGTSPIRAERDQQKWVPVLRPGALQTLNLRMISVAEPPTLWRIMRRGSAGPEVVRSRGKSCRA